MRKTFNHKSHHALRPSVAGLRTTLLGAKHVSFLIIIFLLAACTADDTDTTPTPLHTVSLLLQLPDSATASRASATTGDPGTTVSEAANWDHLAIIFAYSKVNTPSATNGIVVKTLTKTQYAALTNWNASGTVKQYTIELPEGQAYIYGLTYSSGASKTLEASLTGLASKTFTQTNNTDGSASYTTSGSTPNDAVKALTIPNGYATTDVTTANGGATSSEVSATAAEKFLSVATGFYKGTNIDKSDNETTNSDYSSGSPATMTIAAGIEGAANTIPLMRLSRLATIIDVQWDCASAFDGGKAYTDVRLDGFTFATTTNATTSTSNGDKGCGSLFPTLGAAAATAGGTYAIKNDTEIARRNGRSYFYIYPTGAQNGGKITFNISWYVDSKAQETKTHTLNLNTQLMPATWYKINLTVSGASSQAEWTINK